MIGDRGRPKSPSACRLSRLASVWRATRIWPISCTGLSSYAIVGLLLLCALAPTIPAAGTEDSTDSLSWNSLSDQQAKILAPLRADWNRLPDYQRRRLLGTAKSYSKLTPEQQQRFSSRLLQWSRLSLEQRNLARKYYRQMQSLPAVRSIVIQQRWEQWKAAEKSLRSQLQ